MYATQPTAARTESVKTGAGPSNQQVSDYPRKRGQSNSKKWETQTSPPYVDITNGSTYQCFGSTELSTGGSPVQLSELGDVLLDMSKALFDVLGTQNLEATYQRALCLDLADMGISTEQEVPINLMYKGSVVGHRRADVILTLEDGSRAIIELKAVAGNVGREHVKQLQYYLSHFNIDTGFVINFPHDAGFPEIVDDSFYYDVESVGDSTDFTGPHKMDLRKPLSDKSVQVAKVTRRLKSSSEGFPTSKTTAPAAQSVFGSPLAPTHVPALAAAQQPQVSALRYGLTKAGTPCKICLKKEDFCHLHINQMR